ncbi:MAG: septum formation initiator family protein [Odoribacter sp.]|nr:septum formation initiator family protein [Odoribacter sp.]
MYKYRNKISSFTLFSYLCPTMKNQDYKERLHGLFSKLMNKYTMTLLIFMVWLAFFDRNNLVEKMHLRGKITTLKKEKAYYQEKIEEDSRKMQELLSNKKNLEKFAREQYFMKKPNEDIFVIVKE